MDSRRRGIFLIAIGLSLMLTAAIWLACVLTTGDVPAVGHVRLLSDSTVTWPFAVSRWWDILAAPLFAIGLVLIFTAPSFKGDRRAKVSLIAAVVVFGLFGTMSSTTMSDVAAAGFNRAPVPPPAEVPVADPVQSAKPESPLSPRPVVVPMDASRPTHVAPPAKPQTPPQPKSTPPPARPALLAEPPSLPTLGLVGGLGLCAAAGLFMGLLFGSFLRPAQASAWARDWLTDGGFLLGLSFGLGLGLVDGLLIGLVAGGLAALFAGAAYGLGLLAASNVRSLFRKSENDA